ncbi:MAG: ATP-binding protein, partial [Cyanobacteria bacterium P01_C01_bin.89]
MTSESPSKKVDATVDGLKSLTDKLGAFSQWIVEMVLQGQWSKLLLLADVVLILGFKLIQPFLSEWWGVSPGGYALGVLGIFVGAVAIATVEGLAERKKQATPLGDMADRKAIKGLRSFEMGDAEIFSQLERQDFVQECLLAVARKEFRLGVVAGESGAGKTSVLQAGLMPVLTQGFMPGHMGDRFGVYAKFTEREPLETIRRALVSGIEALEWEDVADKNLREMFEAAVMATDRPLLLILDQFEQFFVHFARQGDREAFVQEVAAWYQDPNPAAVGMLIGIRDDWFARLFEFQRALGCVWGPQDIFSLRKFEPEQAANVLETIAKTEGVQCDHRFLVELTEDELSQREDGLISPADVQVLAWTVARSKSPEMRAFDRDAFHKLGGVEGLMERFLKNALSARVTKAQREAATSVLVALTDLEQGTRAGTLLLSDLGEKLRGKLSTETIREAADWLARGDVRLVTVTDGEGARGYELAHERLIPALRRVAGEELSEADKANQLLDRRTNEWLGSDHDSRYLLSWKELRRIRAHQELGVVWGAHERHKRRLIRLSQRRLNFLKGLTGLVAAMISSGA